MDATKIRQITLELIHECREILFKDYHNDKMDGNDYKERDARYASMIYELKNYEDMEIESIRKTNEEMNKFYSSRRT